MSNCIFCDIIAGKAPAAFVRRWDDAIAIAPLNPVVCGHILVIPADHVRDASCSDNITACAIRRAAQLMRSLGGDWNLIANVGETASQTVFHLHVHLVPRRHGDGVVLPWTAAPRTAPNTKADGARSAPVQRVVGQTESQETP